jgi:hypothetical protein
MTADCLSTPTNRKKMFPPKYRSGAVLLWAPVPLPEVEAEEGSLVVVVEVEPPVAEGAGRRDEANKVNARSAQLPAMTVTISKRLIPTLARLSSY